MSEENAGNEFDVTEEIETKLRELGWKSPSEIKSSYVTKEFHGKKLKDEVTRFESRVAGKFSVDEFLANEEMKAKALEAWNVAPDKSVAAKLEDVKQKAWTQFEAEKLTPLAGELEKARKQLAQFQGSDLKARMLQAASALNVKKSLLSEKAGSMMLMNMIGSEYGYDEETGGWYKKGKDGFETSTVKGQTYMSVAEHLAHLKADPEYADLFESEVQSGPKVTPTKGAPAVGQKTAAEKIAAGYAKLPINGVAGQ